MVMASAAVYVIAYWRMKDRNTGAWLLCTDGIAVSHGACPFGDGLDAIYQRHNENYPGEFMEMEYPLRLERYAISTDSGGPGKYRGGCGVVRDVRLLADEGTFGLRVENNLFPAWGVAGGMGGGVSRVVMNPGTPDEREIRAFSDDNHWKCGDLVRICTAGGGGWGDPLERDAERVLDDVKDGFVSLESALSSYGVVIDPEALQFDAPGTEAKRMGMLSARGDTKLFHRFNYYNTEEDRIPVGQPEHAPMISPELNASTPRCPKRWPRQSVRHPGLNHWPKRKSEFVRVGVLRRTRIYVTLKCASVGTQSVPLMGTMSCGHAENATTQSISARSTT